MPDVEATLVRELTVLRRGWGIQATDLRTRIGPELSRRCELPPRVSDRDARRRLKELLKPIVDQFGLDDRMAIVIAFGVEPGSEHPLLRSRIDLLAERLHCSTRTARRRVERAFQRLAEELAGRPDPDDGGDYPDRGWSVQRLKALVRLDKAEPELIEERTIVAARDGLRRISTRFSVPRRLDGDTGVREVSADIQQGARIESRERQGAGHFYFVLSLPSPLSRGDEHTYTIVFRILDGEPIRPYYAFVPLVNCERFEVRVRFDVAQVPRAVWRLNRCPQRVLADPVRPGDPLPLDGAGEIALEFTDIERGYGYGVSWMPAEAATGPPR